MVIREYHNSLKLPVDYYRPIGEFIFRWAQLEYQMKEIIWRALGIDNPTGRTLTIGMGSKPLSATLKTLTLKWITNPTEKQMANSIAKGVRKHENFRNTLVHSSWQYPTGEPWSDVHLHYMRETGQRLLPKAEKHAPKEIQKFADDLKILNEKAQALIFRLDARQ